MYIVEVISFSSDCVEGDNKMKTELGMSNFV
jgi:hypothetical protein